MSVSPEQESRNPEVLFKAEQLPKYDVGVVHQQKVTYRESPDGKFLRRIETTLFETVENGEVVKREEVTKIEDTLPVFLDALPDHISDCTLFDEPQSPPKSPIVPELKRSIGKAENTAEVAAAYEHNSFIGNGFRNNLRWRGRESFIVPRNVWYTQDTETPKEQRVSSSEIPAGSETSPGGPKPWFPLNPRPGPQNPPTGPKRSKKQLKSDRYHDTQTQTERGDS